jgi:hypothetical protein
VANSGIKKKWMLECRNSKADSSQNVIHLSTQRLQEDTVATRKDSDMEVSVPCTAESLLFLWNDMSIWASLQLRSMLHVVLWTVFSAVACLCGSIIHLIFMGKSVVQNTILKYIKLGGQMLSTFLLLRLFFDLCFHGLIA